MHCRKPCLFSVWLCFLGVVIIVGCAPVNPRMPNEVRYVPEDSCSDALAMAFSLANNGDPGGQYSMGFLWARGCGVPRSYRHAYNWYMLAANGGEPRAMVALGDLHQAGLSVERDLDRAYGWFSLAARMGSEEARGRISTMGRPIPAADLVHVERGSRNDSWLRTFAEYFLIGVAAYYGVAPSQGSSSSRPSSSHQNRGFSQRYQTNCFVNTIGNMTTVNCY